MKYIAFLRGINISGKNKLSMVDLKANLKSFGFKNVNTYLNSGNVVFTSNYDDKILIKKQIESIILNQLQLDIPVCVLDLIELERLLNNSPSWWGTDDKNIYDNIIFLIPPTKFEEVYLEFGEPKQDLEKIMCFDNIIFWSFDLKKYQKTNWWSKTASTSVRKRITIRTANTVKKLVEMAKKLNED